MSKIAICIGVNNVKNFTPLQGATKGAIKFSDWAKGQGYEIKLFLDEDKFIVKANDIFDFIQECLNSMRYSQMLIYFSGHGVLRGPKQELWLLSNAGTSPNEFINVTESKDNASTCPIPYVLFVSDACRSLPTHLNQTNGASSIFPIMESIEDNVIDIFYATRPGAVAYEVAGNNLKDAYGIFTETLVEYLDGSYTETIINNDKSEEAEVKWFLNKYYDYKELATNFNYKNLRNPEDKWIISANEVSIKLKEIVENKSFLVSNGQSPQFNISQHKQEYPLSTFTDEQGKNLVLKNEMKIEIKPDPVFRLDETISPIEIVTHYKYKFNFGLERLWSQNKKSDNKTELLTNKLFETNIHLFNRFEDFEETGIQIIGQRIFDFIVPREVEFDMSHSTVKIKTKNPKPYGLLVLKDGKSIPIAIIKGYVAQLIFKGGDLFTINYTPAKSNEYTHYSYHANKEMINSKRIFVANAANNGLSYNSVFDDVNFERLKQGYPDAGSFLRIGKNLDPSLGLYAAYAFKEFENQKKIKSVYNYMQNDNPNVIYDVAMLSGKLSINKSTASFCPVMTSGWSYKRLYKDFINSKIAEAANFLEPGLWTTFNRKGTKILIPEIHQNKI